MNNSLLIIKELYKNYLATKSDNIKRLLMSSVSAYQNKYKVRINFTKPIDNYQAEQEAEQEMDTEQAVKEVFGLCLPAVYP